jgi:hypothetical protein
MNKISTPKFVDYDPACIIPRAVSLVQPAATLIAAGVLRTLYLPWGVDYRGRIYLHASVRWDPINRKVCNTNPYLYALRELGYGKARPVPLGVIVGHADLVDCVYIGETELEGDDETDVVSYVFRDATRANPPGLFAWTFAEPMRAVRCVPCEDSLGLFRITRNTAAAVATLPGSGLAEIPPPDPPRTILQLGWHLMG